MLPVLHRLKKKKDIESALKSDQAFVYGMLMLKVRENKLPVSRFALIVTKKAARKATIRNRIRRVLGEVIRKKLPLFNRNVDGVIIVRNRNEVTFREAEDVIDNLFRQARLL